MSFLPCLPSRTCAADLYGVLLYRKDVDVFQPLVVVGRFKLGHEAMKAVIKKARESGSSPEVVFRMYREYLEDVTQKLKDAVHAGVFRSDTISQILELDEVAPMEDICSNGRNSIAGFMKEVSKRITGVRRYDGMFRAWYTFLEVWNRANSESFLLNSGNLVCAIEVLISQLMFKFAGTNESW